MPEVTVVGLGLMGQALAQAFLAEGHATTVWNRSAGKAERLVAQGAILADSVRAAVVASPLVVVCVSDHQAVRAVLDPLADVLAGRVVVNLTSGTSEQARETARWASERGIGYLDGVIMDVPQGIGTTGAVLYYSGPQAGFDLHEPVLRSLGGATTYLGADPGLSSLYDMATLTMMWSILNGFLHGAALLGTANVPAATFAPAVAKGMATVAEWLPGYAEQIDDGKYPALDATIDTHLAAMEHLVQESEVLGVSVELPRFVKALADRAVAEGHGGEGYAALIEQFRRPIATRG
ncbi:NAD(P)-binding domain-containing protein [Nonomuraea rosea]|uniref:NAD(P)-binding domain-containing protein n=1 Tax=Nonomuraea rosea TaxID=638574 RepID=A0ABP6W416_9ACTN